MFVTKNRSRACVANGYAAYNGENHLEKAELPSA